MSSTSVENKTIRPGSLTGYSYYHSNLPDLSTENSPKRRHRKLIGLIIIILILMVGYFLVPTQAKPVNNTLNSPRTNTPKSAPAKTTQTPAASSSVPAVNECASNQLSQLILVSITQQHLWACQATKEVYNTAVVTGIEYLAADRTPVGTYHIWAKYTDTYLRGSDSTGSWDDYVYYWMPFLTNQYGSYGLHDATWRSTSAFGNISPESANASHGCVELPLSAAKWIYNWSNIGTTVTIED